MTIFDLSKELLHSKKRVANHLELTEKFNQGLDLIREDGTYTKILVKNHI